MALQVMYKGRLNGGFLMYKGRFGRAVLREETLHPVVERTSSQTKVTKSGLYLRVCTFINESKVDHNE